ncbi:hypothetical protein ACFSVK_15935 [Azorhizophilus paspali]|uniref:hypothetical protein n=1 Tax=Azorhizophilus paspali TaxID=69963 RepID=UPI00362C955B
MPERPSTQPFQPSIGQAFHAIALREPIGPAGARPLECHRWAVNRSGFDPSTAIQAPAVATSDDYRRALGACLSGRGYSIN